VIEAKRMVVQVIARVLRILLEGIAAVDGKITEAAEAHPDFFIFQSLPGAGAALAPRLLAALGSQRDRYASAEEVQKYSGICPGDGAEWEKEMGTFSLGVSQVSAAKFSRMGGTLDCAVGLGACLLPATAPAW
jgi:Transposase IS116/IS110/IS902 family